MIQYFTTNKLINNNIKINKISKRKTNNAIQKFTYVQNKKIKNIILLLRYKSNNTRVRQNIQEYKTTKLLKINNLCI